MLRVLLAMRNLFVCLTVILVLACQPGASELSVQTDSTDLRQELRAALGAPLDGAAGLLDLGDAYVARISRDNSGALVRVSIVPRSNLAEEHPEWDDEHH